MRLRELRKENKKTQLEISHLLQVTQQSYARYELETSEPTINTLCKLADYYGVSLDYLVGRNFNNEVGYLDENTKVLLKIFKTLSEDNKIRVIGYAEGVSIAQN